MEALAVALAGLGAAGAVLVLALKGWSAERRAGDQKARADALDAKLTNMAAMLADSTNREKEQRERADDLENAWLAAIAAEPVAGAHARMLEAIAAARAARSGGSGAVSDDEAAPLSRRGDTRLLAPGE